MKSNIIITLEEEKTLLKRFLAAFIAKPYKILKRKTERALNRNPDYKYKEYVDTTYYGYEDFFFDFDKLTIDELTNIVFKAIVHTAREQSADSVIRFSDIFPKVSESLFDKKYLLGNFENYTGEINDFKVAHFFFFQDLEDQLSSRSVKKARNVPLFIRVVSECENDYLSELDPKYDPFDTTDYYISFWLSKDKKKKPRLVEIENM